MDTNQIKAQIHTSADRIESGVAAAAAGLSNGADALGIQRDELLGQLRDIGRRLLDSSRTLTDEAGKQARLRPLGVFGVAFVAGVIVARVLRR